MMRVRVPRCEGTVAETPGPGLQRGSQHPRPRKRPLAELFDAKNCAMSRGDLRQIFSGVGWT